MANDLTIPDIKAAVHEVLDEQRKNFWVDPERHWRDHELLKICEAGKDEWRANHDFVEGIRKNVDEMKRSAFKSTVALLGVGVLLLCSYILAKIKGWM